MPLEGASKPAHMTEEGTKGAALRAASAHTAPRSESRKVQRVELRPRSGSAEWRLSVLKLFGPTDRREFRPRLAGTGWPVSALAILAYPATGS
jgi:hypothetical protein